MMQSQGITLFGVSPRYLIWAGSIPNWRPVILGYPVLMIRMLIVGYAFGIRSERELCRDVAVNLAYRWFCGLSIEDKVPDHSVFSRARNERFFPEHFRTRCRSLY
jgi:hypothetical protein